MLKIEFYGAGREVGRSCIEINYSDQVRLLLDCGVKIKKPSNEYPLSITDPRNIDLAFLSHSHFDHIGAFPFLFYCGFRGEIITTNLSREVGEIILNDALKIEKNNGVVFVDKKWIRLSLKNMVERLEGEIKGVKYKLIPSGHIPGSVAIFLEKEGYPSILYTSDINGRETRLMSRHAFLPRADILIIDSTYGDARQPSRRRTEKRFKSKVLETIKRGGSVIIPSFSVARTQEILLVLDDIKKFSCPIYLDGMAYRVTKVYLNFLHCMKNEKLKWAVARTRVVRNRMRAKIVKKQGIFISSSGMLECSPSSFYLDYLFSDSKSSVLLTGYQANNTPGKKLLDHGVWNHYGTDKKVNCEVCSFSFSSHADQHGIEKIIEGVNPRYIIAQHGDKGISAVAQMAQERDKIAFAPRNGEVLKFN